MSRKKHRITPSGDSERQEKRQKFEAPGARPLSRNPLIIFGVFAFIGLAVYAASRGNRAESGDYFTRVAGGADFRIALASLKLDVAQYFSYPAANGKEIRFFLLRGSDNVVRAAYDSCDVCYRYKQGYYQQGDDMVCRRCKNSFPSTEINVVRGGCNPAPLERTTEGDQLIVKAQDLEAGSFYF